MKKIYYLAKPFFYSEHKHYARFMGLVLMMLSLMQVYCGYLFTRWNKLFYDSLENKDFDSFLLYSGYFMLLAFVFVCVFSLTRYYTQRYVLIWRQWMTEQIIVHWLPKTDKQLEGADQRIQEDIMRFTDLIEKHFLQICNNIILVFVFSPLLFKLTNNISFFELKIPGLLFYVVVLYTLLGMWVSKKLGKPLIQLEYDSQKYEANLRYHLVRAKDSAEYSSSFFEKLFVPIIDNHVGIYKKQKNFNLWQKQYDQFSFLLPFIFAGPCYFSGLLSLGELFQIKSIFSRIRNSIAYILDHYIEFTEIMAIANRLHEFCLDLWPGHSFSDFLATNPTPAMMD